MSLLPIGSYPLLDIMDSTDHEIVRVDGSLDCLKLFARTSRHAKYHILLLLTTNIY